MTDQATPVAVTREDREAVLAYWNDGPALQGTDAHVMDVNDVHPLVQAFARHRATAVKQARHDERLKFVHQPCRHTTKAENETKRHDLHDWQAAQSEWFDATILEIVGEYAAWRDQHTATALADMQRRVEVFRQIGRWEMAWEIAFQLEQPLIDCTEGKPEQASFDTAAKMLSMSIARKASRAFSDLPLEVQFGEGEWAEVIEAARQALSDKTQDDHKM